MHRLVLVAGRPSHAPGFHEFRAGARLLARCLEGVPDLEVQVEEEGRMPGMSPADVAAVVVFSDGGPSHPLLEGDRLSKLGALAGAGGGVGFMHYAVEAPVGHGASELTAWIGGRYEDGVSCNPIWDASFESFPQHPVTRGVHPFRTTDEWYLNVVFEGGSSGGAAPASDSGTVTPILVAIPSDDVRAGPYVWPAGPYPHIVAASGRPEVLMWTVERPDGGRGFGLTGGHTHANWSNDDFRRVVLNALVWVTGAEVPGTGVTSTVTAADIELDLDAPSHL